MPTPNTLSKFLLQTLFIIAVICLSVPPHAYAITTNSGTAQAKSGATGGGSGMNGTQPRDYSQGSYYKQSSYSQAAARANDRQSVPGYSGVIQNNQSGTSRGGTGYGTSKPMSSGGANRPNSNPGSAGDPTSNDDGTIKGSSGRGNTDAGVGLGRSNNSSDNDSTNNNGGFVSAMTSLVSRTVERTKTAIAGGIAGAKTVLESAQKTLGVKPTSVGSTLPTPTYLGQGTVPSAEMVKKMKDAPKTDLPEQIRVAIEKQKATNGGLTDAQVREYEQMNLDEAMSGFQNLQKEKEEFLKQLQERAEGKYTSMDDAKREADLAGRRESVYDYESENGIAVDTRVRRDNAIPTVLLSEYKKKNTPIYNKDISKVLPKTTLPSFADQPALSGTPSVDTAFLKKIEEAEKKFVSADTSTYPSQSLINAAKAKLIQIDVSLNGLANLPKEYTGTKDETASLKEIIQLVEQRDFLENAMKDFGQYNNAGFNKILENSQPSINIEDKRPIKTAQDRERLSNEARFLLAN